MVRWQGTAASELERLEGSILAAAILKFRTHMCHELNLFDKGADWEICY
jgi:hypothetical protein